MEAGNSNFKIVAGLMAGLIILFAAGGLYFWDKSEELARKKDLVEKQANALLSAKGKDISALEGKLQNTSQANASLKNQVKGSDSIIKQQERNLNQLAITNSRRLSLLRDSMANQLTSFNDQTTQLSNENLTLADQNDQLNSEIRMLNEKLQSMVPRSVLTADGFRVEAVKRNDKATAKAKKVHTLTISFNVPSELNLGDKEEVYLSLTDLQGNVTIPPLRTQTVSITDKSSTIPVHAVKTANLGNSSQRIDFIIESTQDIKPGMHRAAVYTNNAYLGSVEFEFRDSLWFF